MSGIVKRLRLAVTSFAADQFSQREGQYDRKVAARVPADGRVGIRVSGRAYILIHFV